MGKKEEKQAAHVFIADPDYGWRPAIQEEIKGDQAIVSVPQYKDEQAMICDAGRGAKSSEKLRVNLKDYPHKVLPLQNVDGNGSLLSFPDMVRLPYLHEAAILYNLKKRHLEGHPYTRTGDIIIAVNPFQWFTDIYTDQKRIYYSSRIVWESSENDPRDGMEPHVYEVSALSYKGLSVDGHDQSILVSGESGAGKTETVKIAMNHMAMVQNDPRKLTPGSAGAELDPVVQRVVESNPLLEAFGNAKTRRNDNSSRFGKYLQLQFDKTGGGPAGMLGSCLLAGSKCDVYLLEKNRVCEHDEKERTYHIFYQLLAAPEDDKRRIWPVLAGKKNEDFKYVMKTDTTKIEGMTDAQHYEHTTNTLALIGVTGEKLDTLMRGISVVMQCGNLTFGAKAGDTDKSCITSSKEASELAGLMGVGIEDLTNAFTERTMKTRTETYKVPLNQVFAKDAADAFAKECYGRIFLWLVDQINTATCAEGNYKNGAGANMEYGIVGLLDIFGFESFVINRFDQLCINYANEKLQQKFTEDVFRAVQKEYEAEGIALAEIKYDDNSDVLDLIEGRGGLLAMLNEECVRPKGNDQDFVQKALTSNKSSACLIVNKMDRMGFGIHHYAGKVMYAAEGFVSANQDTLPTDLEEIGAMSSNSIIATKPAEKEAPTSSKGPTRGPPKRHNLVGETIWGKYKTQLASLMVNLRKTNSRYIRCIKPNMAKVPWKMEHLPTVEQLRCAGVVAAVTLARSAFPNRLDNTAVRFRYGSMWDKNQYPSKKTLNSDPATAARLDAEAILECALKPKEEVKDGKVVKGYVVGKTKSYFRAGALEYLEANRSTGLDSQAITIQKYARGFVCRLRLGKLVGDRQIKEREAREAREAAEKAAAMKKERDAIERAQRRSKEVAEAQKLVDAAKSKLKETDLYKRQKLADAEEAKADLDKEIEELKEKTGADARKAAMEPKKIAAQQAKKLEEQTKLISLLKKENKKIRKDNDKIKEKFTVVKTNNDNLIRANEQAGDDFEVKDESSQKVHLQNERLIDELDQAKKDNKRLKDECMQRQDDYMTQAETRLEYQKTMARILNLIQDTSKDAQVVEDTVCIALECEAEAKSIMAALEAETGS